MIRDALWQERATFALALGILSFLGLGAYLLKTPFEAWSLWYLMPLGVTCACSIIVVCNTLAFSMGSGGGDTNGAGGGGSDGGCGGADGGHC